MKLPVGYVAGQGVKKATGYGGFGERMLRSMGWDNGQGLGKEGQGMKEAIEVKKKEDTVGVGGNGSWNWEDKWWERAFNSAAQTVDHSSDSSDSDSDDDDIDAAKINAAIGGVNRDGTATTASIEELKLMKELSQGGRLAAGRFGGRDAKMERIRAQEAKMAAEAAAKLGVPSASTKLHSAGATTGAHGSDDSDTTSEAALTGSKRKSEKSKDSKKRKRNNDKEGDDAVSSGKALKKEKKAKRKEEKASKDDIAADEEQNGDVKRARIVIEPKGVDSAPRWNFVPTPASGWWGASMFVSAGCLDSMKKDLKGSERAEFTEAQQENLYHAAHAGKTQGKVGLGQRSGPVKVGGVKWEGKKVSFEEEEAVVENSNGSEEDEETAAGRKAALKAVGSCTGLATMAPLDSEPEKTAGELPEWAKSVKWKTLVTRTLESAPKKEMKMKALRSAVAGAVAEKLGSEVKVSKSEVQAQVESIVNGSKKFVVDGKKVKLKE